MVTPTVDRCLPLYGAQGKFYPDSQTIWDGHSEHGGFGFGAWFSDLPDATASHTFHAFGRTWEYSGARSPMGGGVRTQGDGLVLQEVRSK